MVYTNRPAINESQLRDHIRTGGFAIVTVHAPSLAYNGRSPATGDFESMILSLPSNTYGTPFLSVRWCMVGHYIVVCGSEGSGESYRYKIMDYLRPDTKSTEFQRISDADMSWARSHPSTFGDVVLVSHLAGTAATAGASSTPSSGSSTSNAAKNKKKKQAAAKKKAAAKVAAGGTSTETTTGDDDDKEGDEE
jgi:hypothetical protein